MPGAERAPRRPRAAARRPRRTHRRTCAPRMSAARRGDPVGDRRRFARARRQLRPRRRSRAGARIRRLRGAREALLQLADCRDQLLERRLAVVGGERLDSLGDRIEGRSKLRLAVAGVRGLERSKRLLDGLEPRDEIRLALDRNDRAPRRRRLEGLERGTEPESASPTGGAIGAPESDHCSASALASSRRVIDPASTRICPSGRPDCACSATAASTCSFVTYPCSSRISPIERRPRDVSGMALIYTLPGAFARHGAEAARFPTKRLSETPQGCTVTPSRDAIGGGRRHGAAFEVDATPAIERKRRAAYAGDDELVGLVRDGQCVSDGRHGSVDLLQGVAAVVRDEGEERPGRVLLGLGRRGDGRECAAPGDTVGLDDRRPETLDRAAQCVPGLDVARLRLGETAAQSCKPVA